MCKVISLLTNKAGIVASLHISGIPTGFISSLGHTFVACLYKAIAQSENAFGYVAVEDDEVLGFVAFTTDLGSLYKSVIKNSGFKLGFVLARKMFSLYTIKKIIQNILYPGKMKKYNLPDAELLSIVVAPQGRGKGIARQLIEAGFEECRKRGIEKVKVLVAAENEPANNLYKSCGFEFVTNIESHGVQSNIYVKDLA